MHDISSQMFGSEVGCFERDTSYKSLILLIQWCLEKILTCVNNELPWIHANI